MPGPTRRALACCVACGCQPATLARSIAWSLAWSTARSIAFSTACSILLQGQRRGPGVCPEPGHLPHSLLPRAPQVGAAFFLLFTVHVGMANDLRVPCAAQPSPAHTSGGQLCRAAHCAGCMHAAPLLHAGVPPSCLRTLHCVAEAGAMPTICPTHCIASSQLAGGERRAGVAFCLLPLRDKWH